MVVALLPVSLAISEIFFPYKPKQHQKKTRICLLKFQNNQKKEGEGECVEGVSESERMRECTCR
jgi:hypothetical protein